MPNTSGCFPSSGAQLAEILGPCWSKLPIEPLISTFILVVILLVVRVFSVLSNVADSMVLPGATGICVLMGAALINKRLVCWIRVRIVFK
jgi:hypothetical protein